MALTFDEHVARAMLLGLEYDPRDHTYCNFESGFPVGALDADTLEPCKSATWDSRRKLVFDGKLGIHPKLWPNQWRSSK